LYLCNNINSFLISPFAAVHLANLTSFCIEFIFYVLLRRPSKQKNICCHFSAFLRIIFIVFPTVFTVGPAYCQCCYCCALSLIVCVFIYAYIRAYMDMYVIYTIICTHIQYIYPPYVDAWCFFFQLVCSNSFVLNFIIRRRRKKKCLFSCSESWGTFISRPMLWQFCLPVCHYLIFNMLCLLKWKNYAY